MPSNLYTYACPPIPTPLPSIQPILTNTIRFHLAPHIPVSDLLQLLGRRIHPTLMPRLRNLTRMNPIKHDHNRQHKHGIKNIQKHLVAKQIPRIALQVLDDAENAPDHDEAAGKVQVVQMALPGKIVEGVARCEGRGGRRAGELVVALEVDSLLERFVVDEAVVEDAGDDDEEAEEEELREEAGDDEFFARVERGQGAACLDTTACSHVR